MLECNRELSVSLLLSKLYPHESTENLINGQLEKCTITFHHNDIITIPLVVGYDNPALTSISTCSIEAVPYYLMKLKHNCSDCLSYQENF